MSVTHRNNHKNKFIGSLLTILLLLSGLLITAQSQAATRVINSNGGQCAFDGTNGGLSVYVGDNSQFQVERCSANGFTNKSRQYYLTSAVPPNNQLFNSIFLRIGNTVFGANYQASPNWFGTNAAWTSVSSSGGSTLGNGTTTTVYKAVTGGLTYTVTQTVTYVFPNDFYSVKLDVNVPAGNTQNVRLYSWTDIMLDGDDNGSCSRSATFPEYVIADNSAATLYAGYRQRSVANHWNRYWCGFYSDAPYNYIAGTKSGDLPNTLNTTNHDVGSAVQWDIGTVANTTFTAEYDFVFSLNKPTLTKRYGPNDGDTDHSMSAGDTTTLTFTITNRPGTPAQGSMNFTETLPANVTVVGTPTASQCGGTITKGSSGGRDTIRLTGGSMVGGTQSCDIVVNVTSNVASVYPDPSSNITSLNNLKNLANANLTITAAPTGSAFSCTADAYMSVSASSTANTNLYKIVKSGSDYILQLVGSGDNYNALAYNSVDNYMYAIGNSRNLLRVFSNGTTQNLGNVSGLPAVDGFRYVAADMDASGNLYVADDPTNSTSSVTSIYVVNVNSVSVTQTISLSPAIPYATSAYDPAYSGAYVNDLAYSVTDNHIYAFIQSGHLYKINPATGASTLLGSTIGVPGSGSNTSSGIFGAAFADQSGKLSGIDNITGDLYDFDRTTGAMTFRAKAQSGTFNDGAACALSTLFTTYDFSDAPATYGTPSHTILAGLQLGATVPDSDAASQPGTAANLDDTTGTDDEDAIASFPALAAGATTYSLSNIPVTNTTGSTATLYGWVDFNRNGRFDGNEAATASVANGATTATLSWSGLTGVTAGSSYVRLRLTTQALVNANSGTPTNLDTRSEGAATNGEVEDYALSIQAAPTYPSNDATVLYCPAVTTETAYTDYRIAWTYNSPVNTLLPDHTGGGWPNGQFDQAVIAAAPAQIIGSGMGYTFDGDKQTVIHLSNVDKSDAQSAFSGGDYIEYQFTTQASMNPAQLFNGFAFASHDYTQNYQISILFSDDNFVTATTLLSDYAVSPAVGGYQWIDKATDGPLYLKPSTNYKFRIMFYGASNANAVYWDDFHVSLGLCQDFSDAPVINYGSASHDQPRTTTHYLGNAKADAESGVRDGGDAGLNADGDDTGGSTPDDEDGVIIPPLTLGQTATISAAVAGAGGYLQGWIDWDGNGTFDAGEQLATNLQDNGTGDTNLAAGTIAFSVSVPATATTSQTYARFRWSSTAGLNTTTDASNGEVEDYALTITPAATPFTPTLPTDTCQVQAYGWTHTYTPPAGPTTGEQPPYDLYRGGWTYDNTLGYPTRLNTAPVTNTILAPNAKPTELNSTSTPVGDGSDIGEEWLLVSRAEAEPGSAGSFTFTDAGGADHSFAAIMDSTGNILAKQPTVAGTSLYSLIGTQTLNFTYPADGIVYTYIWIADYQLAMGKMTIDSCRLDFGDAPGYAAAQHTIRNGINLGAPYSVEAEAASETTNGDASDDGLDDGVTIPALTQGASATITATVTGAGGYLQGWIDWNGDGDFLDSGEQVATDRQLASGTTGTISVPVTVPAAAITGTPTFARFRWSTTQGLNSTAAASDGEVEDYAITINTIISSCVAVPVTTLVDAYVNANNEYILTDDLNNKSGFIWSNEKINLSKPFDIKLGVYLGSNVGIDPVTGLDSGADGMSFILQNDPRGTAAKGYIGGHMGVDGEQNLAAYGYTDRGVYPSLTVEFDTFDNTFMGFTGDIADDHTGIYLNGDVTLPQASNVLKAATSVGVGGEIEDGKYHITRYIWDPVSQTLTYYFDDIQIASVVYDLVNYFGSEYVTFGFSAATGASKNLQKTCWIDPPQMETPVSSKDYGDAPDTYATTSAATGPQHTIINGVYLGVNVPDGESDGQPGIGANLDGADEDGISTLPVLTTSDRTYSVTVKASNDTTNPATLIGWIDFNGNGKFDADEAAIRTVSAGSGANITLSWSAIPVAIKAGDSYLRLRLTTDTLTNREPGGAKLDGEVEDYAITITTAGVTVSGRVFNDANVNALNDSAEVGVTQLPVVLYDTVSKTCVSTRTDGTGNYTFTDVVAGTYQVYEASREQVPTPKNCGPTFAKNPGAYRSTTDNVRAEFTVTTSDITGQDFGDVKQPVFEPDNSGQILPGNVVFYAHKFTTPAKGRVSVTSADSGNKSSGWSSIIYQDANCDGTLNGSEGAAPIGTGSILVDAEDKVCLINKVYAPSNVAANDQYIQTITANFDYGNAIAGTLALTVRDVTTAKQVQAPALPATPPVVAAPVIPAQAPVPATPTTPYIPATPETPAQAPVAATPVKPVVGPSRLELRKTVQNVSKASAETETVNTAEPGDTLEYRVYYTNSGTGPVTDLVINDTVPPYTTLLGSSSCGVVPSNMTCIASPLSLQDSLNWTFTGSLVGGAGGGGELSGDD